MARKQINDANGVISEIDPTEITPAVTVSVKPEPVVVKVTTSEPANEPALSEQTRLEMEAGRAALAAYASRV